MQPNDVLRRLRYALDLSDAQLARMMSHTGPAVTAAEVVDLLRPDGHDKQVIATPRDLERALDGLIVERRGPPDPKRPPPPVLGNALTNNAVLQKLRIAMTFQEADMLAVLAAGGMTVSPHELGALFRKPSHKNYRVCGDQLLRSFLHGLALGPRGRGTDA